MKELWDFKKKNNISEFKVLVPVLSNACVFTSMFFALRGIANHPVESLKTGGIDWFTDLTMVDPIFMLPLITSTTLFINIKVGGDGMRLEEMPVFLQKFLLFMPWMMLPVMSNFPCVRFPQGCFCLAFILVSFFHRL